MIGSLLCAFLSLVDFCNVPHECKQQQYLSLTEVAAVVVEEAAVRCMAWDVGSNPSEKAVSDMVLVLCPWAMTREPERKEGIESKSSRKAKIDYLLIDRTQTANYFYFIKERFCKIQHLTTKLSSSLEKPKTNGLSINWHQYVLRNHVGRVQYLHINNFYFEAVANFNIISN